MNKIKRFFENIGCCIILPYYWLRAHGVEKMLCEMAFADRTAINQRDVDFLCDRGINISLQALQNNVR